MNEAEVATKRTIMVDIDGFLFPRKIAIRRHNKHSPKKITPKDNTMTEQLTNEDSESRALRSEYQLHASPATKFSAMQKKVRLKNKKTGATVGIHSDYKEASIALAKHPEKHKLFIEGYYMDKKSLVRDLIESKKTIELTESARPLKFSEYRQVFDEQVDLIESQITEKKQLLLDKKKTVNDIEVDPTNESVFDWKNKKSDVDWSSVTKNSEDKPEPKQKVEVDPSAPKRGRGRPPGKYGSYKVKDRSAEEKKAIADKVHSNPERKEKYDAAIAARREFKKLMSDAIKAKQASLAAK